MHKTTDKPRFLITTADRRSWKFDEPVLFLGEWCRLPGQQTAWENLDFKVVAPYGADRALRKTDSDYVYSLYEQLLSELSHALNDYHGTNHSLRYWRISLGTWLIRFIAVVFNRWATIQFALVHHEISNTTVLDFPSEQMIPLDGLGFSSLLFSDNWNHAVYAKILSEWTDVECEKTSIDRGCKQQFNLSSSLTMKQALKRMARRGIAIFGKMFSRSTDAFFISSHLPRMQDFLLQLSLRQFPMLWHSPEYPRVFPDMNSRKSFQLNTDAQTGFEKFIREIISDQIPTCYLEGYSALLEIVEELPWPKYPKVIFTSNSYATDEVFMAWTASKVEAGAPYVIGQHGAGSGGMAEFVLTEPYELDTADRVLTWGWTDGHPKRYPVAVLKLLGKKTADWSPKGGLLLIEVHRDLRTKPWDETAGFKQYLENQFQFADKLPSQIKRNLTVRLLATYDNRDLGWSENVLWKERIPDIQLELGNASIGDLISKSRLVVHSYLSTGILETLSLKIPTMCFWDLNHWPLRSSAQPYFDQLKQVGIFHDSTESIAEKVVDVWDDVEGWWNQPEVQEARQMFCDQFACMPQKPIEILKQALMSAKPTRIC